MQGPMKSSMILASHPVLVHREVASELESLEISLSEAIRQGKSGFKEIGMEQAYTGAPSEMSKEEESDFIKNTQIWSLQK